MKVEVPQMDAAEARHEFADLIADQAAACLWFMRDPGAVSLLDPGAARVLEAIIRHGTRAAWRRAKELQAWRSQNIR